MAGKPITSHHHPLHIDGDSSSPVVGSEQANENSGSVVECATNEPVTAAIDGELSNIEGEKETEKGPEARQRKRTSARGGQCGHIAACTPHVLPVQDSSLPECPRMASPSSSGPQTAAAPAAGGESLEDGIDAIEQQIKEAMARLSSTGESFLASLERKPQGDLKGGGGHIVLSQPAAPAAVASGPALAARLRASLDYNALFGVGR